MVGFLLASVGDLAISLLNITLVEDGLIDCDLVSKGSVPDQLNPVFLVLVVDDGPDLAARIEDVNRLVKAGLVGVEEDKGQAGGGHSGPAGVGEAHAPLKGPYKELIFPENVGEVDVYPVAEVGVLPVQAAADHAEDVILESGTVDEADQVRVRYRNGTEAQLGPNLWCGGGEQAVMPQIIERQGFLVETDWRDLDGKGGDPGSQVVLLADTEAGIDGVDLELIEVVPAGDVTSDRPQAIAAHRSLTSVSVDYPHLGLGTVAERLIDHEDAVSAAQQPGLGVSDVSGKLTEFRIRQGLVQTRLVQDEELVLGTMDFE